jgi:hypothetical protein
VTEVPAQTVICARNADDALSVKIT